MKTICTLSIIFCFVLSASSQVTFVIAKGGLNLRNEPSAESEILRSIPFGSKIKTYHRDQGVNDSLGGENGSWLKIKFEEITGYVWDKYVTDEYNPNIKFVVLLEGALIEERTVYSNPDLIWYGVFDNENNDLNELRRIKLDFVNNQIKTNIEEETLFILGSLTKLDEGLIPGVSFKPGVESYRQDIESIFLYPEQKHELYIENVDGIILKARDKPLCIDGEPRSSYALELSKSFDYYSGKVTAQNLTPQIPWVDGPAFHCSTYLNPLLYWYGDIDGDQKIDLIIKSRLMQDTEGIDLAATLFVSTLSDQDNLFVGKSMHLNYYHPTYD